MGKKLKLRFGTLLEKKDSLLLLLLTIEALLVLSLYMILVAGLLLRVLVAGLMSLKCHPAAHHYCLKQSTFVVGASGKTPLLQLFSYCCSLRALYSGCIMQS